MADLLKNYIQKVWKIFIAMANKYPLYFSSALQVTALYLENTLSRCI